LKSKKCAGAIITVLVLFCRDARFCVSTGSCVSAAKICPLKNILFLGRPTRDRADPPAGEAHPHTVEASTWVGPYITIWRGCVTAGGCVSTATMIWRVCVSPDSRTRQKRKGGVHRLVNGDIFSITSLAASISA
jgi:hypothetical protein